MNKDRKEYKDREFAKLVNPPITYGEWEVSRFMQGLRKCQECNGLLDTAQVDIYTCFECYAENQRAPKSYK
jgi:hypothetical protein